MNQAPKEAADANFNKYEIKYSCIYRESSVQEAVYHITPELWLKKKILQFYYRE